VWPVYHTLYPACPLPHTTHQVVKITFLNFSLFSPSCSLPGPECRHLLSQFCFWPHCCLSAWLEVTPPWILMMFRPRDSSTLISPPQYTTRPRLTMRHLSSEPSLLVLTPSLLRTSLKLADCGTVGTIFLMDPIKINWGQFLDPIKTMISLLIGDIGRLENQSGKISPQTTIIIGHSQDNFIAKLTYFHLSTTL